MDALNVSFDVIASTEVLATNVTNVWLSTCVYLHVSFQMDIFGKGNPTGWAREWLLPSMGVEMDSQDAVTVEIFAAEFT